MKDKDFKKYIVFEDNHLLVVNKPAGLLVQGDKTNDKTLIDFTKQYIKYEYNKPGNVFLGLTHRLDRPVSGAVIMTKTSKALTRVTKAFKNQEVGKTYIAICLGKPNASSGIIQNYLLKDGQKNKVRVFKSAQKKAKFSETEYNVLQYTNGKSLVKIAPKTGRSHQIRVHLSSINIPIIGDLKYGAPKPLSDKSIALHCLNMELIHPVTKEKISFKASLPETSFWKPYISFLDKN